ncbi:pyridoxal phosphate-dependent decarboxylase family protein [Vogesella oryzae]|uniref:pyridoxal phosphate-dependent decarboxylase family protein n=1 Tax=Vogesella oryzae TaxID=1735285 RepID=UPI001583683E|nr:aspartate aminotransferase family protein [Vogesella oryzae]
MSIKQIVGSERQTHSAADVPGKRHLFNQHNLAAFRQGIEQSLQLVSHRLAAVSQPFSGVLPQELAPAFAGIDLDTPAADQAAVLAELAALYLDDAVYFHHPRYVAHLNCPVVLPAIMAELVLASVNSSLDTWDQSAGGTFIEQKLIDWTIGHIGLGPDADGVFTSGGTQSNLMALLLARDTYHARRGHSVKLSGLPAEARRLRILCSTASHFSVQKSAALLGLGYDSVICVPCDERQRMDVSALAATLAQCHAAGEVPLAVVATAGTTDFGSIDPLPEIAAQCRAHGIWLHVDAAYGGALLLSPTRRHWLDGIELADSVTVDYHKSFFQPVSCSAFFARERRDFAHLTWHADYLNPLSAAQEGTPNLVNKSIQTTRRFDALKLWLTLRSMGAAEIGAMFDHVIDLAQQGYRLLHGEAWLQFAAAPQLSTLVLRYAPDSAQDDAQLDAANAYIRKAIFRSGEAVIAGTRVGGRQYLKFTLLNPETTLDDLAAVATLIRRYGDEYLATTRAPLALSA